MNRLGDVSRNEEGKEEGAQDKGKARTLFARMKEKMAERFKSGLMKLAVVGMVTSGAAALNSGCASDSTSDVVPITDAGPDSDADTADGSSDAGVVDGDTDAGRVDGGDVDSGQADGDVDSGVADADVADGDVDSGVADADVADGDVDSGVADADPDVVACTLSLDNWSGVMDVTLNPDETVGGVTFTYIGVDASGDPQWNLTDCYGATIAAGLTGVEYGEMTYPLGSGFQARIQAGGANAQKVNCTIRVEPVPSGG